MLIYANIIEPLEERYKSRLLLIECNNCEKCDLYKKGLCKLISFNFTINRFCPYGNCKEIEGFSRKTKRYNIWRNSILENYADIYNKLKSAPETLTIIDEYIWLPYSYFDNYVNPLKWINKQMTLLSEFDIDRAVQIIKYKPLAIGGGEITEFQNKYVTLFCKQLKDNYSELFNQVINIFPEVKDLINTSNVGRKALLSSIKPNVVFKDNKTTYLWTGEYLSCTNYNLVFPIIKSVKNELRLYPEVNQIIEITEDNQVDEDTIYV